MCDTIQVTVLAAAVEVNVESCWAGLNTGGSRCVVNRMYSGEAPHNNNNDNDKLCRWGYWRVW